MLTERKVISIKRRIDISQSDPLLVKMIRHNCNVRHIIRNKFVEELNKWYDETNTYLTFDFSECASRLNFEENERISERILSGEDTSLFCTDIVKGVRADMRKGLKSMCTAGKKLHREFKFKVRSADPFRGSFKVRSGNELNVRADGTIAPIGKIKFSGYQSDRVNRLVFTSSRMKVFNAFDITLCEPVADEYNSDTFMFTSYDKFEPSKERCYFRHDDIKEVGFLEEMNKFYIILVVKMTYCIDDESITNRRKLCGIDLGIRNPVVGYDGESYYLQRMSTSQETKINVMIKRLKSMRKALINKYNLNLKRFVLSGHLEDEFDPMTSNNYGKLLYKFRKRYARVRYIRERWRWDTANLIASTFDSIVVDGFAQPDNSDLDFPKSKIAAINSHNRDHAMFYFHETLKHASKKRGCIMVDAPDFTTARCSKCGHIGDPLPLTERVSRCEDCGYEEDRDRNAAKNCYLLFTQ